MCEKNNSIKKPQKNLSQESKQECFQYVTPHTKDYGWAVMIQVDRKCEY
jgi:hypothetical protein